MNRFPADMTRIEAHVPARPVERAPYWWAVVRYASERTARAGHHLRRSSPLLRRAWAREYDLWSDIYDAALAHLAALD